MEITSYILSLLFVFSFGVFVGGWLTVIKQTILINTFLDGVSLLINQIKTRNEVI